MNVKEIIDGIIAVEKGYAMTLTTLAGQPVGASRSV
jgi:hypothetical protein